MMLPELLYPEPLQLTFQETVLLPFEVYLHFPTSILPATNIPCKMKDIRTKLKYMVTMIIIIYYQLPVLHQLQ